MSQYYIQRAQRSWRDVLPQKVCSTRMCPRERTTQEERDWRAQKNFALIDTILDKPMDVLEIQKQTDLLETHVRQALDYGIRIGAVRKRKHGIYNVYSRKNA